MPARAERSACGGPQSGDCCSNYVRTWTGLARFIFGADLPSSSRRLSRRATSRGTFRHVLRDSCFALRRARSSCDFDPLWGPRRTEGRTQIQAHPMTGVFRVGQTASCA